MRNQKMACAMVGVVAVLAMTVLAAAKKTYEDVHLDLAVWSGDLETVRYFVEKGCDIQKVRATATPEIAAYLKSQGRQ